MTNYTSYTNCTRYAHERAHANANAHARMHVHYMQVANYARLVAIVFLSIIAGCSNKPFQSDDAYSNTSDITPENLSLEPEVIEPVLTGSYWTEFVRYPFSVHYAEATDDQQQVWKMAYVDEYTGQLEKKEAPVVVLVHCRCGNLGYFSRLIRKLRPYYRVIAFDLPNYGKSLPLNMTLPINQSFETSRGLIHQVLTDKLEIKEINLIGHSTGGQWAIGFALKYPSYVNSLVLESSYGLEAYEVKTMSVAGSAINLFDVAFVAGKPLPESVWYSSSLLNTEYSLSEHELKARFFGAEEQTYADLPLWAKSKLDHQNGTSGSAGLFQKDQPDARFFVKSRALASVGDLQEYDRLIKSCVWDMYASAAELRSDDPANLFAQLRNLRVKTFLAFGQQDVFLPNTAMTGKRTLKSDLVDPALIKIRAGGTPSIAKIYPYAAHTPHIDVSHQFETDILHFFEKGVVDGGF
jgi:pimeloyl-ACP methyl ester carboxylesterase